MREIRTYGSEGGGAERFFLPLLLSPPHHGWENGVKARMSRVAAARFSYLQVIDMRFQSPCGFWPEFNRHVLPTIEGVIPNAREARRAFASARA